MNTNEPVVEVRDLRKSFGEAEAVRGVTFSVERGSIFGLIGANGSGKSTTLRCILGLLQPDEGTATVFGADSRSLPKEVRRRVGYLSEKAFPFQDLFVPEILGIQAALFPHWDGAKAEALMKRMRIPTDRLLQGMSFGERRRAELFLALSPDPELLVLDDPWLGLDAAVRRDFLLATLEMTREQGKTVLFTSHVLTDVERVADRVAILRRGTVRTMDDLDALKARTRRLVFSLPAGADPAGVAVPGEISRSTLHGTLTVVTDAWRPDLEARLAERHGPVGVETLNLEALFVEVVGADDGESGED